METILEEAQRLVAGDRQDDYGHPLDCCDRIGRLWSVALGIDVPAEKVAECLWLMKYARLLHDYKRDTVVDMAGYVMVYQMIVDEREKRDRERIQDLAQKSAERLKKSYEQEGASISVGRTGLFPANASLTGWSGVQ